MPQSPSLSTDQIEAFVQLARCGSLRSAAESLHISEQGVRNRLIALEQRLGAELYRKSRGMRKVTPLTNHGKHFLPHAISFLERAEMLTEVFSEPAQREVNVVASQYLIAYVLIEVVRRFHAANPDIRIRLSARTEQEIEQELLGNPDVSIGVAAPYESSPHLDYSHLFSMNWSVIAPVRHPLLKKRQLRLRDLVDEPMILYEQGSTGRQHIIEAFQKQSLSPRVEMAATNTDLIVRMVEAGLGISVVPLLSSGVVTRGRRVGIQSLGRQIRSINSGVIVRKNERLADAGQRFVEFVAESSPKD